MNEAVVRCHQVAPRHVEIRAIDQTSVAVDQRRAIEPIERRKLIPGQPAAQVMGDMQVVEEEQRPENASVLGSPCASPTRRLRDARRRSAPTPGSCRDRRSRRDIPISAVAAAVRDAWNGKPRGRAVLFWHGLQCVPVLVWIIGVCGTQARQCPTKSPLIQGGSYICPESVSKNHDFGEPAIR